MRDDGQRVAAQLSKDSAVFRQNQNVLDLVAELDVRQESGFECS